MFITMYAFRARTGEEDAIVALHELWILRLQSQYKGFISGELFAGTGDPQNYICINQFDSELSARESEHDPDFAFWFNRVVSLSDGTTVKSYLQAEPFIGNSA